MERKPSCKRKRYASILPGTVFGRLTLVEQLPRGASGLLLWQCDCTCGQRGVFQARFIVKGKRKSCGCLKVEQVRGLGSGRRLAPGQSNARALFKNYKNGAKTRGLEFNLTFDGFCALSQRPCYYCGQEPGTIFDRKYSAGPRRGEPCSYGAFVYNGVDRVDNALGYTTDNSKPCCGTCNRAKRTQSLPEFVAWSRRLYEHLVVRGLTEERPAALGSAGPGGGQ